MRSSMKIVSQKPPLKMYDRLAHRVARSSQATPAAVDKSSSASNTKIQTAPQHAQKHIVNNDWLPLQRDKKQLEQELKRYDDIGAQWRDKPEVQEILGAAI